MKTKKLPNKPSKLIRVALDDLKKSERSDKYEVNMGIWHTPNLSSSPTNICQVCLAGSVIAHTLKVSMLQTVEPENFNERITRQLYALNDFRTGSCEAAFRELDLEEHIGQKFNRAITYYYKETKVQFHKDMRKLARDLEKAGY